MKRGLAHMLLIRASATHMPQVPASDYVTALEMVSGYLLDIFLSVRFMSDPGKGIRVLFQKGLSCNFNILS